jgi:arsenate reductase
MIRFKYKIKGGEKMKNLFIEYPKCSTCQKAKKWLDENKIEYVDRNIVTETPTKEELKKWITKSGLDVRKFFNTSGMKYRELNIKEKIKDMSEDEIYELLASDGMLIKRPLFISDTLILKGFKEKEWEQIKGENNAIN